MLPLARPAATKFLMTSTTISCSHTSSSHTYDPTDINLKQKKKKIDIKIQIVKKAKLLTWQIFLKLKMAGFALYIYI